jgi:HEPN domain-containing protein
MKTVTADWLRSARTDLDTINAIRNQPQLSPIVAFHAQQCIEKCLKALLEEYNIEIRKTHNLLTLKVSKGRWCKTTYPFEYCSISGNSS